MKKSIHIQEGSWLLSFRTLNSLITTTTKRFILTYQALHFMSISGTDLKITSGVGWKKLQTHVKHTQLGGSDAALVVSSFQTLEFNWIQWCHITRIENGAEVSAGRLLFRKQLYNYLGLRSHRMNWIRFGSAPLNEKIGIILGKLSFCSFRVFLSMQDQQWQKMQNGTDQCVVNTECNGDTCLFF